MAKKIRNFVGRQTLLFISGCASSKWLLGNYAGSGSRPFLGNNLRNLGASLDDVGHAMVKLGQRWEG